MSDLIDRQEAIKAVESLPNCYNGFSDTYDKACIIGVLEELPSVQPEPHWISCSERMPEYDTDVLISYRYKEGEGDTSHTYIDITSFGDMYFGGNAVHDAFGKRIKHWRQPFAYFTSNYEVVAWMPLPEPWRGGQDETD